MAGSYALRNRALLHSIVLPIMLLTVALLGGIRVGAESHEFIFIVPPLVTLVLSVLLLLLFVRAHLIELKSWLSVEQHLSANLSNALILLSLFFASAQAFNSVLPEAGLLHWLFSFCFLWTLWNNQLSYFDTRRLMRSLAMLFGTAFLLKHIVLASFFSKNEGLFKRLASALFQGIAPGVLTGAAFAPATGYIAFITLSIYVAALLLLQPSPLQEAPVSLTRIDHGGTAVAELEALDERETNLKIEDAANREPFETLDRQAGPRR